MFPYLIVHNWLAWETYRGDQWPANYVFSIARFFYGLIERGRFACTIRCSSRLVLEDIGGVTESRSCTRPPFTCGCFSFCLVFSLQASISEGDLCVRSTFTAMLCAKGQAVSCLCQSGAPRGKKKFWKPEAGADLSLCSTKTETHVWARLLRFYCVVVWPNY